MLASAPRDHALDSTPLLLPVRRPGGGIALLRRQTMVPTGLEKTFEFFSDARNLNKLTPPWVGFKILTPPPIAMHVGTLIDYQIRLRGVPLRWRTQIVVWDPPHRFVDVQLKGPYRWWHHTHRFEAFGAGTRVIDEVEYRSPLPWIMHPLIVSREVQRIFDYRASALLTHLPPDAPAESDQP